MNRVLDGQWAIVTGATTGIGRATALRLAEMGANVAIHYHSQKQAADELMARLREMGVETRAAQGDFTDRQAVFRVIGELGAEGIDVLVQNAGSLIQRYAVDEMPLEYWDEVLALNLSSAFWTVRAALPHLREGARIVTMSSIAAYNGGGFGAFAYAAAKGGVISLTRGLAKALAPRGIRVNAVAPGTIDTPYHEKFSRPQDLAQLAGRIPLGRLGTADECAQVIGFLAGPQSSYVTGEVVAIHGGQSLVW